MMGIIIGRMEESDISRILKIQAENQRDHVTPSRRKEGYLSIAFSADEFRGFDQDLCVVVAKEDREVIGYCCISSSGFNARFPILDQIVARLSSFPLPGSKHVPVKEKTCIYGPVCVSLSHRGRGVLSKLSSFGLKTAKERGYSHCLSFISTENVHSIRAHRRLFFHRVGMVHHNGKEYMVIGIAL